jgi:copper homeostasis protein
VRHCIERGCDGIVTGILNKDGTVDMERNMQLVNMARQHGLGATFHRAFDMCANQEQALEDVILCGFERILTSGGKSFAIEGASVIKHLVDKAADRITIMPGGGISESNVGSLVHFTGVTEVHASARNLIESQMEYQNDHIMMGVGQYNDEYAVDVTDAARVKELIKQANAF